VLIHRDEIGINSERAITHNRKIHMKSFWLVIGLADICVGLYDIISPPHSALLIGLGVWLIGLGAYMVYTVIPSELK